MSDHLTANMQLFFSSLVIRHCVSPDDVREMAAMFGDHKEDYLTACQLMDVGYSVQKSNSKNIVG
jgi:hypothetical protein